MRTDCPDNLDCHYYPDCLNSPDCPHYFEEVIWVLWGCFVVEN